MARDDMLDDGKAQPGPAGIAATACINPIKALGQPREVLRFNARSPVADNEFDGIGIPQNGDGHWLAGPAMPNSVLNEVADKLRQLASISWQGSMRDRFWRHDSTDPGLRRIDVCNGTLRHL